MKEDRVRRTGAIMVIEFEVIQLSRFRNEAILR